MGQTKKIRVGIGFATGRKSFQKVLKTYVYNWRECGLTNTENVSLSLFVAYDLKYSNTKITDYTRVGADVLQYIDETYFIGNSSMQKEINTLIESGVVTSKEARLVFGSGYAAKRNAILYTAIKNHIDYLLFLDDDEYPLAVTKTRSNVVWGGQEVLSTHLKHIQNADITNGNHCGYISPIPSLTFNDTLKEHDFRLFVESISNDIVNWDSMKATMRNGGVTYADTSVLTSEDAREVPEEQHAKFITGANLCINLTNPLRVSPFYNPPGARGEDTFLSTCLHDRKVLRVPCYAFHDGFSTYRHLMDGVLPIRLMPISADNSTVVERFYNACIGWIRYKPLFVYITQREHYGEKMEEMKDKLTVTLPKICEYFGKPEFMNILKELAVYERNVTKHYNQFLQTQQIWKRIIKSTASLFESA